MNKYLTLIENCLIDGLEKTNRTGTNHIGYHGDMRKYNLKDGFPLLTTKEMNYRSIFAEMLSFLRGYDNAGDFRNLGTKVWDANANKNEHWLSSPHRKGVDDLGRVYGVQARGWGGGIDQLKKCVEDLSKGIDNRREIVTHWNPSEMARMALPPCHLLYQFGIQGDTLNLSMYQRSCDVPLGIPFNIAGYAWLLSVIAHITKLKVGVFTHFMHDIHIYKNQVELANEQLTRKPLALPELIINAQIKTLEDLETWVTVDDFEIVHYQSHEAIKYPFAL